MHDMCIMVTMGHAHKDSRGATSTSAEPHIWWLPQGCCCRRLWRAPGCAGRLKGRCAGECAGCPWLSLEVQKGEAGGPRDLWRRPAADRIDVNVSKIELDACNALRTGHAVTSTAQARVPLLPLLLLMHAHAQHSHAQGQQHKSMCGCSP
jgi:hypothetical protein